MVQKDCTRRCVFEFHISMLLLLSPTDTLTFHRQHQAEAEREKERTLIVIGRTLSIHTLKNVLLSSSASEIEKQ